MDSDEIKAWVVMYSFTFIFAGIFLYRGRKILFGERADIETPNPFWGPLILIMLYATVVSFCLITFVQLVSDSLGLNTHPLTAVVFVIGSAIVVDFINHTRAVINKFLDDLTGEKPQSEGD